jgi:riboflavin kinase/FMN adenylyltransferase
VEAYLLDFSEDIYDETVTLEFIQRLRNELKYDTVEALIEQIRKDVEQTRQILGTA